ARRGGTTMTWRVDGASLVLFLIAYRRQFAVPPSVVERNRLSKRAQSALHHLQLPPPRAPRQRRLRTIRHRPRDQRLRRADRGIRRVRAGLRPFVRRRPDPRGRRDRSRQPPLYETTCLRYVLL